MMSKNYFSNRPEEKITEQVNEVKELIKFFKNKCNVYSYICYGTLLGAVRDKNVIDSDTDFDIAYISNYTETKDIKKELKTHKGKKFINFVKFDL